MPLSHPAVQRETIWRATEELQSWEAVVARLTRDYAAAKTALGRRPADAAAREAFVARGDRLMEAMVERHRREKVLERIRKRFRL
ncbi:hypothetical protein BKE38_24885 [Pseudoroseomonas deserti]|uniref:Uncharacterized protein n=1 Tax=Teichococcus deserti TaxID=1817963 RepID=A0A1V2GXW1_9PROT|nr:hypothetical protein [Pseudoroseomonas deserti]ONG46743.1 hypothetical protein BKE38_24885 [Pseudoroseomonas deserti]